MAATKYLYELLFRISPDGGVSRHAIYCTRDVVDGEVVEQIGAAQPITDTELELAVGDVAAALLRSAQQGAEP